MWIAIVEAYNRSVDVVFRILDWLNGRPIAILKEKRKVQEDANRAAQIKGDINEMQRTRAEIEEIDRNIKSLGGK